VIFKIDVHRPMQLKIKKKPNKQTKTQQTRVIMKKKPLFSIKRKTG
jgi:hypothetical protein